MLDSNHIHNNRNHHHNDINDHNYDDDYVNYDSSKTETTLLHFRTARNMGEDEDDDDSGCSSPPLWKAAAVVRPGQAQLRQPHGHHARSLSPAARAQAIARGQREMMEMVKAMPETTYELSLKDLVEYREEKTQEECLIGGQNDCVDDGGGGGKEEEEAAAGAEQRHAAAMVKRQASNRAKMVRSGSVDNRGLFLKMVFPVRVRSRRKKNSPATSAAAKTGAKVSPRPDGSSEKEWWKRRSSASTESVGSVVTGSSDTSGRSGSSGSSGSRSSASQRAGSRKRNGIIRSCYSCFQSKKDKQKERKA